MSKILKGLNEANPHNYDSDWDYQNAVAKSGKSRSSYRSQEDDTSDADIAYSKKMYQLSQKQKRDADHDRLATGTNEDDSNQTRMRMNDYYDLADAIQDKLKQAIQIGNNELIQKYSEERDKLDARIKKYGLMPESQLDELSNNKLGQYKTAAASDAGKADSQGDYNRANKRTKKQFANDEKKSNMDEADENSLDPFKHVNPRVNNPKILGTQNRAKSAYYPPSKPPVKKLDKPLPESLGNQLNSTSLDALVKAKLEIERQREADTEVKSKLEIEKQRQREVDIEAWRQDFQKNTVQKAQQGLRKEFQQDYYALKDKLVQLDIVIKKHKEVDELLKAIKKTYRHHIVAEKIDQIDNRLLQDVKAGTVDNYNYKSLLIKLTQLLPDLAKQYPTAVEYLAKKKGVTENHDERDEYDNPRQGRDYGKGNLFVDPGSNEFKREVHLGANAGERGRPKNLKGISTKLPADAFGRTTGKIPAGKRGKVYNKMSNTDDVDEGWSQKYKSSINCSHPKGFSQKAHCAGKKKHNESIEMEMVCEDCGMCETHVDHENLDEACWKGYHKEGNKKMFGKTYPNCVKNTNEEQLDEKCWDSHKQVGMKNKGGKQVPNCVPKESVEEQHSHSESCPHCGGEMVSEELMNEKKDACYYKVKSRYKVWPSAYASGALVKCRNKGASNWGNGGKKNESSILEGIEQADESLHDWFNKEKWVRMDTKGNIKGPCAKEPGEGKPKCLPQSKAHSLGKKGRASAAQRKRREDPNPERSGKAINVNTKKSKG
jgi:hypothetical protein